VSLSAAAVVAITLIATTITSTWLATRARRAESEARQQARRAEEELARANAIVGFTGNLLDAIRPSVARGRDTALLQEILNESIREVDVSLAGQPSVELSVRYMIGSALSDLGDDKAALEQLRKVYDATANTPLHDHPERIRGAILMANILVARDGTKEAQKLIDETMQSLRRTGQDNSNLGHKARLAQAGVYLHDGRDALAEKQFAELLAHYRAAGLGESNDAIVTWNNLALAISDQGRWDEALKLWQELNAMDRRLFGENHPYTLMTQLDIGTSLARLKRFDEAEAALREALKVARSVYEPGHPTLLSIMNNFASMLTDRDKLAEADAILTEALETGRKKLGPLDSPMEVLVLHLSQLRRQQGRHDEAVRLACDLHGALVDKFGARHSKTLSLVVLVFDNLLTANRSAEGVALFESIGELPDDLPPDISQRLHACAGRMYLATGDEPNARKHALRAREAVRPGPDGQPRVTGSLRLLETQLKMTPSTGATTSVSR
jgi:tetratricopeptide (TPR) repeat protein